MQMTSQQVAGTDWEGGCVTAGHADVMVAVGPQGVAEGTLSFAAAEAARRRTGIELVHVVPELPPETLGMPPSEDIVSTMATVGREALGASSQRLRRQLSNEIALSTRMAEGSVVTTLIDLSVSKALVVLERRELVSFERFITMSTSTRVAARARAAVTIVPRDWRPRRSDLPITVGMGLGGEASSELLCGLEYAQATARSLRLLHAMWPGEPLRSSRPVQEMRRQWRVHAAAEMERIVGSGPAPDVATICDVQWSPPAEALVDATVDSALLILSRRPPGTTDASHVGSITRAVLARARCPVLLVDRAPGHPARPMTYASGPA